jgi:hypothetical protein
VLLTLLPQKAIRAITGAGGHTETARETFSHKYGFENFSICLAIEPDSEKFSHILQFFVNHSCT